ncbi:hypothetical protein SDRG_06492 [Saprolegnia diclina VS20]|uniref:subtilisin n=1 Tax=Saprolegnia diclina (strain VS20) TaxID=1156394 RepID=T0QEP8_SAPDV|nr:hypothetical protein SDRG_06492 [Saprolegnia diclina VS20]EQC36389.1 hypothetical protein SDRG_06492 [Saprolegnia diclina VS20]|eukprot:XP_008610495.1 hypothetical protein SDRG_06492 [Saprolegnia diclina VS20]
MLRLEQLAVTLLALTSSATAWRRLERAHEADTMELRIQLQAEADLAAQLAAISDVTSATYGRYLSNLDTAARPSDAAAAAMQALLSKYNPVVSRAGDLWRVTLPVADVETLFDTKVHAYSLETRRILRASNGVVMPKSIAAHVVLIDGLDRLPRTKARASRRRLQYGANNPLASVVTIETLQEQYHLPKDLDSSYDGNGVVIGTFLEETYMETDIESYLGVNGQAPLSVMPAQRNCIGNGTGKTATSEASLDAQLIAGLTRNNATTILCYNDLRVPDEPASDANQEPFLRFMRDVNALEPAPSVVSISYADDECALPLSYRNALDLEFIKAGLRGTTIVVASGDNGVVGSWYLEDFGPKLCAKYQPSYPSSSPYIVSVGATVNVGGKETGLSIRNGGAITTGGGFSADSPRPSYQASVVDAYVARHSLDKPRFNVSGRAYPDVSALGHSIALYIAGFYTSCDGTSASAPIVAAIISHLNKYRLRTGRPKLGFVNPYLYKLYEVCPFIFNDIVAGENGCGALNQPCCDNGFAAGFGWDPIGGLGSINYHAFETNMEACEALMKITP